MLVFIVGYMGCGKTTVGKKLALKLGYSFIDLDAVIEKEQKQSIQGIFKNRGSQAFRLIEKKALHNTFKLTNSVISAGGGAPCFFDNIEQMNRHGKTIYIKMAPKALVNRLAAAKNERPLIKEKTGKELLVFIENALAEREPFYSKSHFTVNGLGLTAKAIKELIL